MTLIVWNELTEKKLRKLVEGGMTHEAAGKVLQMSRSTIYNACQKLGIHRPKEPTSAEQILKLCESAQGKDAAELSKALGISRKRVNDLLHRLITAGQVWRGGTPRFLRYFLTAEAAKQYGVDLERQAVKKQAEEREKFAEKRNARMRLLRANRRLQKTEAEQAKMAAIALPRPLIVTPPPVVEIVQGVKVTRYQTPPNLFDFTPPPGWRGQITHDWMNRRLGAAS